MGTNEHTNKPKSTQHNSEIKTNTILNLIMFFLYKVQQSHQSKFSKHQTKMKYLAHSTLRRTLTTLKLDMKHLMAHRH